MATVPTTNPQPFCLVQLSDSHLSADPEAQYRGFNADETLKQLRPSLQQLEPDALVLSGDVSEDGSAASYERIAAMLDGMSDQIAWLPGNHDEHDTMARALDRPGFTRGPVLDWGGWQIVLLDSAWHDRPEGELDDERLEPLDQLDGDRPALVFVHHQPIRIGSPWIDKYPLIENHRLWDRLDAGIVRAVAFGHVHQLFEGEHHGIACLSAPSTVANSHPGTDTFTPDASGPAARWFELWPDGQWKTGIVRGEQAGE